MDTAVFRAQVKTFDLYREMLGMAGGDIASPVGHPIMLLRLLPAYRTPASVRVRKLVADRMRAIRAGEKA